MCSLQFDKKAVYDIHMSFVHKKAKKKMVKMGNEDLAQKVVFESITSSQKIASSNGTEKSSTEYSFCDDRIPQKPTLKVNTLSVQERKKPYVCSTYM